MDDEQAYYARRIAEERARAARTAPAEVRRVHAELADRYEALITARPPPSDRSSPAR